MEKLDFVIGLLEEPEDFLDLHFCYLKKCFGDSESSFFTKFPKVKKYFEQNRKLKINEFYDADNAGKENEKPPNKIDPKKVEAAERIVLIRLVQVKKFEFKLCFRIMKILNLMSSGVQ